MYQIVKNNNEMMKDKPLVFGFFEEQSSVFVNEKIDADITALFNQGLVDKKLGNISKVYTLGKLQNPVVYLVCLGKLKTYSKQQLEEALVHVNYKLGKELNLNVQSFLGKLEKVDVVTTIVQAVGYYNYVFDELLTKKLENDLTLNLVFDSEQEFNEEIKEVFNNVVASNNIRDLVNKPYNFLNAVDLANYAEGLVAELGNSKVSHKIYNKKEIEALEMGSFLGVNKGSTAEPRLIHLKYNGGKGDYLGLVGKGVMFDTGGYSLKSSMNNMKNDMAGAATSLGVFEAAVKNNLPVNLQVIICATDNKIDGNATVTDDVLVAMNKMTIEVANTDAEGRLTLADALTFAQRQGCKELIDIATLTGSVVVALGDDVTGLFGNDQKTIDKFLKATKEANEGFWQMPITKEVRALVRSSKVADLINSTGRIMGASSAAAFLEAFVEDGTKWMHLDVAGTAFTTSPRAGQFYGATAAGFKSIYEYIKKK